MRGASELSWQLRFLKCKTAWPLACHCERGESRHCVAEAISHCPPGASQRQEGTYFTEYLRKRLSQEKKENAN